MRTETTQTLDEEAQQICSEYRNLLERVAQLSARIKIPGLERSLFEWSSLETRVATFKDVLHREQLHRSIQSKLTQEELDLLKPYGFKQK